MQAASGDVLVVVTVPTIEPYADIREYAVKLFENHGRGIGEKGKDNGILILLALKERRVWIEVGYGLEQWITDGFAGETSRDYMTPDFRAGRYGAGLLKGSATDRRPDRPGAQRHAHRRGDSLGRAAADTARTFPSPFSFLIFLAIMLFSRRRGGPGRGVRRWGGGGWSGWSSGVGPFGGGWSGGGGGGFGGGFGGFGGGRSGGGGGGASW